LKTPEIAVFGRLAAAAQQHFCGLHAAAIILVQNRANRNVKEVRG